MTGILKWRPLFLNALVVLWAVTALVPDAGAEGRREVSFVRRTDGTGDALPVTRGASGAADAAREAKNRRYDRMFAQPVDLNGAPKRYELRTPWWSKLPLLPVGQSDLIVLAEVTDARAYLTPSRSGLYSAFTLRVIDKLHGADAGGQVVAERVGGAVIHPDGGVTALTVALQGVPQMGGTYVMFLRRIGADYELLTGYAIANGRVAPLDGRGTTLGFERYDGTEANAFLKEVRAAVAARGK